MLHDDASPKYTAIVRQTVFGLALVRVAALPLWTLSALPVEAFKPPAPIAWLPRVGEQAMLSVPALIALQVVTSFLCLGCLSEKSFRWTIVPCCVALTIYQSLVRGFGHINHAELVIVLSAFVFAVGLLSDYRFEPMACAFFLSLSYMLTGTYRVVHGGIDVFASNSMAIWSVENSLRTEQFSFHFGVLMAHSAAGRAALDFGFVVITAVEILGPWAMLSRWFRCVYALLMAGFHAMVFLSMKILFIESFALLLILFAWPEIVRAVRKPGRRGHLPIELRFGHDAPNSA